jgi:hypothetical protein
MTGAALAVQRFDKLSCCQGGILWRCHIESHRALQYGPFYYQCLSMEIAWLCARFYTSVSNGVAEIAESNHLKECPHTFIYIVYDSLINYDHFLYAPIHQWSFYKEHGKHNTFMTCVMCI